MFQVRVGKILSTYIYIYKIAGDLTSPESLDHFIRPELWHDYLRVFDWHSTANHRTNAASAYHNQLSKWIKISVYVCVGGGWKQCRQCRHFKFWTVEICKRWKISRKKYYVTKVSSDTHRAQRRQSGSTLNALPVLLG